MRLSFGCLALVLSLLSVSCHALSFGSGETQSSGNIFYGPTELKAFKGDAVTIYGPATLEEVTLKGTLTVMGPLSFSKLKVAQAAEIMGPVEGKAGSSFQNLKVAGPVDLTDSTVEHMNVTGPMTVKQVHIEGSTEVVGPLHAEQTTFDGDILVTSDEALFEECTLNNITVRDNGSDKAQRLILRGKTEVKGAIRFESGRGTLVVEGDKVTYKSVDGAGNISTPPAATEGAAPAR